MFDPIKVYPRTDHMGDDYLKVFIIYDGKMEDLDAAHRPYGLITQDQTEAPCAGHQRLRLMTGLWKNPNGTA